MFLSLTAKERARGFGLLRTFLELLLLALKPREVLVGLLEQVYVPLYAEVEFLYITGVFGSGIACHTKAIFVDNGAKRLEMS